MKIFSLFLYDAIHTHVFRWTCDDTVTHYIYQGRVGDNTREYRGVKERGLHVVSQYWLRAVCFFFYYFLFESIEFAQSYLLLLNLLFTCTLFL